MAVARLSGPWILEILRTSYPDGVLRRMLLDDFARVLVTPRSSPGAKGRIARRLYSRLARLQRRGRITQEEGIVRLVGASSPRPKAGEAPPLGPILQKKLFLALMAEDRPEAAGRKAQLHAARWAFLAEAIAQGWTLDQAAATLGLGVPAARQILETPPRPAPA